MFVHSALARCPLVFDSLITLLIFLVGVGLGRLLLRLLHVDIDDRMERGFFAAALGVGALTYLPFALFAAGIGRPPIVVGALLLMALALLPEEVRVVRGTWQGFAASVREWRERGPAWTWLLAVALASLLVVTYLQALCPPTDPDGLAYHLTAPLRYLAAGRFFYMPTFLHVHWPLGIEMLFGIGLAFNAHYAASMVHFGLGILLLLGTYTLGKRIASPAVGWLAATLLFSLIRGYMTIAYVDLGLSLLTLAAVYAFFVGRQALQNSHATNEWGLAAPTPDVRRRWWRLSAVLAGLTATTKLPGILSVGVLAILVFLTLWTNRAGERTEPPGERLRFAFLPALGYLIIGLVVAAPWFLRCWALTHDPFYPYFASIFGARDWNGAAQKRLNEYFQMFNTLRTMNPTPEMVVRARAVTCLGLAIIGAALCAWRATRPILPLLAFLFISAFLQVATSGIYVRYFLPLFPLTVLLVLWAIRQPLARSTGVQWAAAILVTLRLWGMHHAPGAIRDAISDGREGLRVALGSTSRDAYLERLPIYASLRWANANLPPEATLILGVWDPYAALVERRTLTTNVWVQNALRFDSLPNLLADVERLHATHLLIHTDAPVEPGAFVNKEDSLRKQTEFALLEQLAKQYGTPLYHQNDYTLYALRLPASG